MSDKQEEALELSIAHWERMRDGKRIYQFGRNELEKPFGEDCACCILASKSKRITLEDEEGFEFESACRGCPIFEYTSKPDCENTPWDDAAYIDPNTPQFKVPAQNMINHMKTVLVWVQNGKPDER